MDATELRELITQAGIVLALFAPASAALLTLIRQVWAFPGKYAAVAAGLINVAAVTLALLGLLPQWAYVVAAALIATVGPAVAYDAATRPGRASEHEAMANEWADIEDNADTVADAGVEPEPVPGAGSV